MKRILAVEIGGTFTDVVYLTGEGRLFTLKIASTPGKPEQGVFSAIEELRLDLPSLDELIHGSTIATNAIIERKGARAAFVTTGGFKDILNIQRGDKRNTYDTSTDVCLINRGKPEVNTENQIAGLPMGAPMIDIVNVGAGGGSIAWIDQGGMMRVGPQSAGAQPGPVCYGKGGQIPTVTDAYVAMGLLRPTQFIGGKFPLDKEKAV